MPISQLDGILRRGLGIAGKVIGTYFNVYRLSATSAATSIIDSRNLVLENYPARIVLAAPKIVKEQTEIYNMVYIGLCDTRPLQPGDVCVEVAPTLTDTPDGRVFVFADVQPLLGPVFIRTEVYAGLSRPNGPDRTADPIQGLTQYQGTSKFDESIYTLANGLYSVKYSGTPAVIPMGLQPKNRIGPPQEMKFPTATVRGSYVGYIPLLPGLQVHPGDFMTDQNGNRYRFEVVTAYTVGIQGYQLLVETVFV
jgi:hypothetical protein